MPLGPRAASQKPALAGSPSDGQVSTRVGTDLAKPALTYVDRSLLFRAGPRQRPRTRAWPSLFPPIFSVGMTVVCALACLGEHGPGQSAPGSGGLAAARSHTHTHTHNASNLMHTRSRH